MKIHFFIINFLFVHALTFCQIDSIHKNNKYIIGLIPSKANNIYGLAIGPLGSEVLCDIRHTRYSHGINIQIGQGFIHTFFGSVNYELINCIFVV